ncbi:cold-shock protein [Streptosporangium sp. DT93]|uniref:cold-shock protein n=1 Tax=Streptosporangium sp. DT93 TaxID=3393428 RepID=UPI003CF3259B
MKPLSLGRLVRFDEARGYGFITPQSGGSDIFMHANEFLSDKQLLQPGTLVEYETSQSERGLRATAVRSVDEPVAASVNRPTRPESAGGCDAVLTDELLRRITDMIIERAPSTTGLQIAQLRQGFTDMARSQGWVLD